MPWSTAIPRLRKRAFDPHPPGGEVRTSSRGAPF
jgi:hypothetical protein